MQKPALNRDTVSGEALFILRNLRENGRLGRSNKLADVKAALEPSVSLEFDNYFFFLRKFHYIAMDREAQLKLTEQGEQVAGGELTERFSLEVGEFFAEQLAAAVEASAEQAGGDEALVMPPPPPELLLDEAEVEGPPVPAAPPSPPPMPPVRSSRSAMPALDLGTPPAPVPMPPPAPRAEAAEPRRESTVIVQGPFTQVSAAEPSPTLPAPAAAPMSFSNAPTPAAAAPAASAPKGSELDLRYQKFDPIGTGPLGTVFKGRVTALGLDICLKELKDIFGYFSFLQRGEVLKRLKKELCAQAQVRHPGVVQVVDQNVDAARPYFVLELMQGSLRERLDAGEGNGVPVPFALRAFLQMAYGLRAAHAAGLTHHNIKPENVLFDVYGNAKLADFGLGRVVEVDSTKGMPQVFVGTGGMPYMAPELMNRGGKEPGASADVYALGILLYEMLTGQIPGRRSPLPSEVNSEAPSGLDQLFDKATQDKREQRYPDVDAMLEDFYTAFPDREFLGKGDLIISSDAPKE